MSAIVAPRRIVLSSFLLSLAGLGVAIYMTIAHFEGAQILACPVSHVLNCEAVTTSPQSYFLGVPVAVWGLADYVVMSILNSPWAWRSSRDIVWQARTVVAVGSMAFVLWLIYAEVLIIGHICIWCTSVHAITLVILLLVMRSVGYRTVE